MLYGFKKKRIYCVSSVYFCTCIFGEKVSLSWKSWWQTLKNKKVNLSWKSLAVVESLLGLMHDSSFETVNCNIYDDVIYIIMCGTWTFSGTFYRNCTVPAVLVANAHAQIVSRVHIF